MGAQKFLAKFILNLITNSENDMKQYKLSFDVNKFI